MMNNPLSDLLFKLVEGGMKVNKTAYCLECETAACKHDKELFQTAIRCKKNRVFRVGVHK